MKGLLLKDFYMIGKYCRGYMVIMLIFLFVSFAGEGNLFFLFYPCVLPGLITVTLLAYDEREKWNLYEGTLPVTRAQIVSGKYSISLILGGCVLALISIVQGIAGIARGGAGGGGYLMPLFCMALFVLLVPAFILPFVFRLGAERGRIAYVVVIVGAAACIATLLGVRTTETGFMLKLPTGAGAAGLLIGAAAFALSWLLSVRIYEKREF